MHECYLLRSETLGWWLSKFGYDTAGLLKEKVSRNMSINHLQNERNETPRHLETWNYCRSSSLPFGLGLLQHRASSSDLLQRERIYMLVRVWLSRLLGLCVVPLYLGYFPSLTNAPDLESYRSGNRSWIGHRVHVVRHYSFKLFAQSTGHHSVQWPLRSWVSWTGTTIWEFHGDHSDWYPQRSGADSYCSLFLDRSASSLVLKFFSMAHRRSTLFQAGPSPTFGQANVTVNVK